MSGALCMGTNQRSHRTTGRQPHLRGGVPRRRRHVHDRAHLGVAGVVHGLAVGPRYPFLRRHPPLRLAVRGLLQDLRVEPGPPPADVGVQLDRVHLRHLRRRTLPARVPGVPGVPCLRRVQDLPQDLLCGRQRGRAVAQLAHGLVEVRDAGAVLRPLEGGLGVAEPCRQLPLQRLPAVQGGLGDVTHVAVRLRAGRCTREEGGHG